MPNSIMTIPTGNSIVLRDYSINVRRMMSLLQTFDVPDSGDPLPEPKARKIQ